MCPSDTSSRIDVNAAMTGYGTFWTGRCDPDIGCVQCVRDRLRAGKSSGRFVT